MKPTNFKYSNKTLNANPETSYSKNVTGVDPLPIWTDNEQCVSCWKMSWKERLSALIFGRVWLSLLSGQTQPPAALNCQREYLKESKAG